MKCLSPVAFFPFFLLPCFPHRTTLQLITRVPFSTPKIEAGHRIATQHHCNISFYPGAESGETIMREGEKREVMRRSRTAEGMGGVLREN